MNTNDAFISIPEAADIYRHKLNHVSANKYDSIYRNILAQTKSGKFNVIMPNSRSFLINKQEFCDYVESLLNAPYEQIQFDLDKINVNNSVNNKCNLKELLTLIKLHRKLCIPAEETLRYIERLLSDLN